MEKNCALQVREAAEVHVGETPGDSQALDGGVREQAAAEEVVQKAGPPKKDRWAPKLDEATKKKAAERFASGEKLSDLAKEYGVSDKYLRRYFVKVGVYKKQTIKADLSRDMIEFVKRARSILWRQDGPDKKTYNAWDARVKEFQESSGYSKDQSVVRASKEFPCLNRLFREYDVAAFDPNPESHPQLPVYGQVRKSEIHVEGRELSYRDNLRWAIEAAGLYLRTGEQPFECPNNSAFYLYQQAISEPKDFLSRVGQVESRGDGELEEQRLARKAGKRSVAEIEEMLAALEMSDG